MGDNIVDLSLERQRRDARRARPPARCPECGGVEDDEKELLHAGSSFGERCAIELEADLEEALAEMWAEDDAMAEGGDGDIDEREVENMPTRVTGLPRWSSVEDGDITF